MGKLIEKRRKQKAQCKEREERKAGEVNSSLGGVERGVKGHSPC